MVMIQEGIQHNITTKTSANKDLLRRISRLETVVSPVLALECTHRYRVVFLHPFQDFPVAEYCYSKWLDTKTRAQPRQNNELSLQGCCKCMCPTLHIPGRSKNPVNLQDT